MTKQRPAVGAGAWDLAAAEGLIEGLWALRRAMLDHQARLAPGLAGVDAAHRDSAVNLAHYLAMRQVDLRALQDGLAWMGLSSLGRAEPAALANVDKVLGLLHRVVGRPWLSHAADEPLGSVRGPALLAAHAQALFGAVPAGRDVRIMVTLPSEAAGDPALVQALVDQGMDVARINCAHDSAEAWTAMAGHVRQAARQARRTVRVLMDLGGPKLRTGALPAAPAVLKLKPLRDALGRIQAPDHLGLRPPGSATVVAGARVQAQADAAWLARLAVGDRIDLTDARAAHRALHVLARQGDAVLLACHATAYLAPDTVLRWHQRGAGHHKTVLDGLPAPAGHLLLRRGDLLQLLPEGLGHGPQAAARGRRPRPAAIACTLPAALGQVRKHDRVWFDDGHIGGVVRQRARGRVTVEITDARDGGERLAADKGINLPDTRLDLPALTAQDLADLPAVARLADIVGLSFAQSAGDVQGLRQHLQQLGAGHLALMLKIETRRGFEHLPELLLAAMAAPAAGVMIARGDLAVECGYERLAEVQEEILWACEAAHMPVVWATQVLESLAKTGLPSRAEVTDAAMGGRAECVMLNKGPHILDAIRTLDGILRRMQTHQAKKRPLLRALKSWRMSGPPRVGRPGEAPAR